MEICKVLDILKNLLDFNGELFVGDINDEKVLKKSKILNPK